MGEIVAAFGATPMKRRVVANSTVDEDDNDDVLFGEIAEASRDCVHLSAIEAAGLVVELHDSQLAPSCRTG